MLVEGKATAGADIGFCLDNGDDETEQSCCPTKRCWQSTVEESLTTKPENLQNGTLNESSKSRNNNNNGSSSGSRDFDGWLRSFGLKSRDEMPFYCHESYILHGYRPNPSSLAFCLRSLFHPTNETLNVWTHAIPAVLLIWFNMSFAYNNLDGVIGWTDHIMLPYWIFTLGIGISLLGSSGAHLFNCMSPAVREVCFCCDYGFIAFQAMGITCFFTFYLCPYTCMGYYKGEWFLIYVAIMLGNVGSVSAACHTRYPNVPLRYLFRVLPFAVMYTILNIPCITKYSAIDETDSSTVALNNHDIHGNLSSTLACGIASTREGASDFYKLTWSMLLGAIINAAKLPERLKPGFFDIVGHSHQIFHLLVVFGIYYICKLLHIALGDVVRMRKTGAFPQAEDLNITSFTGLAIPVMCCVLSLMVSVRYSLDFYVRCKALKLIDKVQ